MGDCKLSHVDPKVDDKFVEDMKQEYESIFKDGSGNMTVNRDKIYKHLEMTIDYTNKGFCKIAMFYDMKEILETLKNIDPESTGTKSSAASTNLIAVRDD